LVCGWGWRNIGEKEKRNRVKAEVVCEREIK